MSLKQLICDYLKLEQTSEEKKEEVLAVLEEVISKRLILLILNKLNFSDKKNFLLLLENQAEKDADWFDFANLRIPDFLVLADQEIEKTLIETKLGV